MRFRKLTRDLEWIPPETLHFGKDIGDMKTNVLAIDIGGVRM